eukprot:31093-Pelagococcus_subviridis.AAC.13
MDERWLLDGAFCISVYSPLRSLRRLRREWLVHHTVVAASIHASLAPPRAPRLSRGAARLLARGVAVVRSKIQQIFRLPGPRGGGGRLQWYSTAAGKEYNT